MSPTAPARDDATTRSPSSASVAWAAGSVIVLWASAFVGVGYALRELEPGPLALARYLVAAAVLWAWSWLTRRADPGPPRRDAKRIGTADRARMALCGLLGIAVYNLALNLGQRTMGAGMASLLVNTVPIWTALLSALWLSEPVTRRGAAGVALAFGGVALIGLQRGGPLGLEPGALWILLAALAQAAFFVLQRPLLRRLRPIDLTRHAVGFGVLCLLPFSGQLLSSLPRCGAGTLATVLFLGVGPAALAYVAWAHVLGRVPAARAANLLFLVPVVAIGLAALLLGERPTGPSLVGGGLAIAGVALSRTPPKPDGP